MSLSIFQAFFCLIRNNPCFELLSCLISVGSKLHRKGEWGVVGGGGGGGCEGQVNKGGGRSVKMQNARHQKKNFPLFAIGGWVLRQTVFFSCSLFLRHILAKCREDWLIW